MPIITITTTPEEQQIVLKAIKVLEGQTIPVTTLIKEAGIPESRVRYALTDLIEAGKVIRTPTKAFNKHYVRYKYSIAQEAK